MFRKRSPASFPAKSALVLLVLLAVFLLYLRSRFATVYIFGYGSLINKASRARTGITGEQYPVLVHGLTRSWDYVYPNQTALGVRLSENSDDVVNGVLFEVWMSELPKFDEREAHYVRTRLSVDQVKPYGHYSAFPAGRDIWVYLNPRPVQARPACPVLQSYLDTVVLGCLAIGEDFAKLFISSTAGWDGAWVNDRNANTEYAKRNVFLESERALVDKYLEVHVPDHWSRRVEWEEGVHQTGPCTDYTAQ